MTDVDGRVFKILLAMAISSLVLIALGGLSLGYGILNLSIAVVLFWLLWWRGASHKYFLWAILDQMAENNADVSPFPKPKPINLVFARLAARITMINPNAPDPMR